MFQSVDKPTHEVTGDKMHKSSPPVAFVAPVVSSSTKPRSVIIIYTTVYIIHVHVCKLYMQSLNLYLVKFQRITGFVWSF